MDVRLLYRFRDTISYLSKVAFLTYLHLAPPLDITPCEFHRDVWQQKPSVPQLSCGIVCMIPDLAILIQYQACHTHTHTHRQIDRRTDRQTHDDGISRTSIALRGKNQ